MTKETDLPKTSVPKKPGSQAAAVALALAGLFHTIFASGCLLGWPAIMTMLNREGHYAALCPKDPVTGYQPNSCTDVDVYSSNIFATALACQAFLTLPLGLLLDWMGPKGSVFYQIVCVIGMMVMTAAKPYTGTGIDVMRAGFILLCATGASFVTLHLHVGNLLPKIRAVYCCVVTASFGVTSIIFSIFELIQDHTGLRLRMFLYIYLGCLIAFSFLTLLLPMEKFGEYDSCGFSLAPFRDSATNKYVWGFFRIPPAPKEIIIEDKLKKNVLDGSAVVIVSTSLTTTTDEPHKRTSLNRVVVAKLYDVFKLSKRPQFVFVVIIGCIWYFVASFYIASLHLQLTSVAFRILGRPDQAATAPNIEDVNVILGAQVAMLHRVFTWSVCSGVLFAAVSGAIVDRYGFSIGWLLQMTIGIIHLAVQYIPNLPVQVVAFFGYTGFQELFFALAFSYIGIRISWDYQNALGGVFLFCCAVCNLLVNPVVAHLVATRVMATAFYPTLITFTVLGLATFVYPYYIYKLEGIKPTVAA